MRRVLGRLNRSGIALAAVAIALCLAASAVAFAAEEINLTSDGVILHGYDSVAYFVERKPIKGSARHKTEYRGAIYWFASAENRAMFEAEPEIYAPAYGGWCSYGVRVGKKFDIDPNAWQIVENRLFVQLDQGTQLVWAKDKNRNIAIADRLWSSIRSVPVSVLGE